MPRLFIAVDLPDDRCRNLQRLRNDDLPARWTPPDQYHVTLRFLGDVGDEAASALQNRLEEIDLPSFLLGGERLGVFPSRRKPRVLVAHMSEDPGLMALQSQISNLTHDLGFEEDHKPFNPHITVARLKNAAPQEVRRYLREHELFTIEPFAVEAFRLYESRLGPDGAEHAILKEYGLRTASAGGD